MVVDCVNAIPSTDIHRLHVQEGPSWTGSSEDFFQQQGSQEDPMCPIYTDGNFHAAQAADLAQYAEEAQPSPKWRHPVTVQSTPAGSTAVEGGMQQATHDISHMLGQPTAAPRREMTCEFNDESAPTASEPRPPPQADYSIGEKVAYYSETHNTWMEATVNRQNVVDGAVISYDLDVKRGALATKIRRLPAADRKSVV